MDTLAYRHAPYGRYEVRKKVPHVPHHMNDWSWDDNFEFDHEADNSNINRGWYHATIYRNVLYGPFKGVFRKGLDTEFISHTPEWWAAANNPQLIVIDGFPYQVRLKGVTDTVVANGRMLYIHWPSSVVDRTDSVTFYYSRQDWKKSDTLTWKALQDGSGKWRIIDAPYHINRSHDTLRFSKAFQPLLISLDTDGFNHHKTFECYWDSSLNWPDTTHGLLWLKSDSLLSSDIHSKREIDTFFVEEGMNYHYCLPPVQFTNPNDSVTYYAPSSYQYHTFSIELLPNEMRFLLDSNVIRRYPDRLIPTRDKHANWITTLPRFTPDLYIAQMTLDGVDAANLVKLKNHIADCPGCADITIDGITHHAAHTRVDYYKVFDMPDDVAIAGFPH